MYDKWLEVCPGFAVKCKIIYSFWKFALIEYEDFNGRIGNDLVWKEDLIERIIDK